MSLAFVHPEDVQTNHFTIREEEAKHLISVLRNKVGDEVFCFNGKGKKFSGLIERIDVKNRIVEGTVKFARDESEEGPRLVLWQGLPKGSKFDYVIEKAVEVGASEIVPFISEKSLIKIDEKGSAKKLERWNRLALAATKQCERPFLTPVKPVVSFSDVIKAVQRKETFVFHLDSSLPLLSESVKGLDQNVGHIHLVVGPESGFTNQEIIAFEKNKAHLSQLGPNVLRTETAGLVALSALRVHFGLI